MKVAGVICKSCGTFVYSRARHDFRYCHCKSIAVDGGPGFTRIIGNGEFEIAETEINATLSELYDDWNLYEKPDVYGWIKDFKKKGV